MTDTWLKSVVDRIENLEGERKEIGGEIRDVYSEAKGKQYNVKAIRKLIAQRRQKTDEQLEADIEKYKAALGMHGSYRKAAAALGITKSKLHRTVPREENGTPTPPHDSETVVRAETDCVDGTVCLDVRCDLEGCLKSCGGVESRHAPVRESTADVVRCSNPLAGEAAVMAAGTDPVKAGESTPLSSHRGGSESRQAGVAPGPQDTDPWEAADESFARLQAMKRERGFAVAPDGAADPGQRINALETA